MLQEIKPVPHHGIVPARRPLLRRIPETNFIVVIFDFHGVHDVRNAPRLRAGVAPRKLRSDIDMSRSTAVLVLSVADEEVVSTVIVEDTEGNIIWNLPIELAA